MGGRREAGLWRRRTERQTATTKMTTSRDDGGDIVRDLVPSWLRSANLGYAIPNFEMAGIVTPRSLADLELRYFGPLGVTDGDDRKRLFYLVQRVRGELRREKEEEDDNNEEKKAKAAKAVAVAAVVRDLGRDKEMERRAGEEDNDYDDDYAGDDDAFQSPSSSDFDSRDRGELTSTVVVATMTTARGIRDGGMDVISPVTMSSSSPLLASGDNHKRRLDRHHRHNHHHDDVGGDDDGGIVVSAAGIESSPFQASGRIRHSHLDHRGGNNDGGGGGKTAGAGAGTPVASAGQVSSPASAAAAAATGGATGGGG